MTDGQGSCVSITVQVMQMFDKAEAEYRELSGKKRIVENDKDKIRKVRLFIHQNPAYRMSTLDSACRKENGSIISGAQSLR